MIMIMIMIMIMKMIMIMIIIIIIMCVGRRGVGCIFSGLFTISIGFLRLNKVFVWEEGEAALVFQRYLTYYLDLALKTKKRNKQTANKKKNKQEEAHYH